MGTETRFLILSLDGESYAIPIDRVAEITVPLDLQKNGKLTEVFEGQVEYRGKRLPVLNLKKTFKLSGERGNVLLIVKSGKGDIGMLVDAVTEILDIDKKPIPMPPAVVNPSLPYYRGILRHKGDLVLLLNEDGLL
jgi:purine-binding chemotaxis protein CheW